MSSRRNDAEYLYLDYWRIAEALSYVLQIYSLENGSIPVLSFRISAYSLVSTLLIAGIANLGLDPLFVELYEVIWIVNFACLVDFLWDPFHCSTASPHSVAAMSKVGFI